MKNYEINFKNIPLDLEPDENITLWRYMSFSSLCEILMYNHIPLISISKFSDKSEGVILRGILSKLPNTHNDGLEYAMQKYYKTIYLIFLILVLNLIIINRNKVYRHENAFLLCRFSLTFIA